MGSFRESVFVDNITQRTAASIHAIIKKYKLLEVHMKIAREQKEIIDPKYVLVPQTRIYDVIAAIEEIKELEYIKFAYQDCPRLLDRLVMDILSHAMVHLNTRYISYQLDQFCFAAIYKAQKVKKLYSRKIKLKGKKAKYPSIAQYPKTRRRIFLK